MLLRGAVEERLLHRNGGSASHPCLPGTLIGASPLITDAVKGYAQVKRRSILMEVNRTDLGRMLRDPRIGTTLWNRLQMQQFPQRAPDVEVLLDRADRIMLRRATAGTRVSLGVLGRFLWRHMDGHHTLEQLAQVLAMTSGRPDNTKILALIEKLRAAEYIHVPTLHPPTP